jgi:hypothetical protein
MFKTSIIMVACATGASRALQVQHRHKMNLNLDEYLEDDNNFGAEEPMYSFAQKE